MLRVTTRNARFQQWEALLDQPRPSASAAGEFLVQGVRPITLAVEHGWQIRALLYDAERDAVALGRRAAGPRRARPRRAWPPS